MTDPKKYHIRSEFYAIPDGAATEAESHDEAIQNVKNGYYWFERDKDKDAKKVADEPDE